MKAAETVEDTGKSCIIKEAKVNLQLFADKTKHAEERSVQRNLADSEIGDALEHPLFVGEVVIDELGRKSVKYIGNDATVVINPDTGIILEDWFKNLQEIQEGVIGVKFNEEQTDFMKRIGISIDFSKPLRDDQLEQIEEKASEHLQMKGFGKDYSPTADGKMCEEILDMM